MAGTPNAEIARRKTSDAADTTLGRSNGPTTVDSTRHGAAPDTAAASSTDRSTIFKELAMMRNTDGYRWSVITKMIPCREYTSIGGAVR